MENDAAGDCEKVDGELRTLFQVDQLLRNVPGVRRERLALRDLMQREADALIVAHHAGQVETAYVIRGGKYRPGEADPTDGQLLAQPLSREAAVEAIAKWHWFNDLEDALAHADATVDPQFESACDCVVDGNLEKLRLLIEADPSLAASARSPFAHHQTLLQHVAANGIENSRQWQSPRNAPEIAKLLLDAGADPSAMCDSYGGSSTMGLLVTSAHPARAGVTQDLVELLCQYGAARPS